MMIAHRSRRCSKCKVNWPPSAESFDPCPECGEMTYRSNNQPIMLAKALSRKRHADFERWLDEHDRRDPVEELERIPVREKAA